MIRGSIVALITPFTDHNQIDEKALRKLINWQIEEGIDAIIPCGTTGESATLSHEEHRHVIDIVIDEAKKRIPIIAGAGSNNTKEAYDLTVHAKKSGADAVLSIAPYYNKPTQRGFIEHYKALGEIGIPLIIYNVPGRTGSNIEAATQLEIANLPNIMATKEASGNIGQIMEILRAKPPDFQVFSGDDSLAFPLIAMGASGCISVVANEIPRKFSEMVHLALEKKFTEALEIHNHFLPLMNANFIETNPIPVKTAMALMEKIQLKFRLPICEMKTENFQKFQELLRSYNLIPAK